MVKMRPFIFLLLCAFVAGVQTDDVSMMEGNSVTLHTGLKTRGKHTKIKWYFNDIPIAQSKGSWSKLFINAQCDGLFRDRLKLNNHTGDLTVTDIKTSNAGHYRLQIIRKSSNIQKMFIVAVQGVSALVKEDVLVQEGESVTLDPGVKNPSDMMTWYFNDTLIAEINGNQSYICTDIQCDERFGDRLEMDHQTGSLTITNTTITDSGLYKLQMSSGFIKNFSVTVTGNLVAPYSDSDVHFVSLEENDSVILHTDVETRQQRKIQWYFYDVLIAEITGDLSFICTDVQCSKGTERFRGRLKLDNQTGSLTITNARYTDLGRYKLQINGGSSKKIFGVIVSGFTETTSQKEGKSVTFYDDLIKHRFNVLKWYFKDTLIAEFNADLRYHCVDEQCDESNEGFRDRLDLGWTGSLTIRNTRTTDSGGYYLHRSCSVGRYSIIRRFSLTVTAVQDPGVSPVPVVLIIVGVPLAVTFLLCCLCILVERTKCTRKTRRGPV
ncbi:uncharacterized protein LOC122327355 isoform X2 [Puntigrus tetrazona]|uniref:uncharacterized protein LOC122327355 isoform X2 n=1 Tax=Puntigrus tetrazona TaxID=1606681 RepID=UPI001C8AF357|nr:uncharacterized protein LOC122327355 isoform X2 [Puntigrus tetrazona]